MLVRQRPGSAKGVVFMTIEDETGIANIVVWPKVMNKFRKEVMGARLIEVHGIIQSSPDKIVHLVASRLLDRTSDLKSLASDTSDSGHWDSSLGSVGSPNNDSRLRTSPMQKTRHPRDVRILPPSRDFH